MIPLSTLFWSTSLFSFFLPASPSFPLKFCGICLQQTLSPLPLPPVSISPPTHIFLSYPPLAPGPTDQPPDRPANHYCFQRKPNWTDSPRKVPRDRVVWNSFLRSIDHKRWQNGGRVVKARARPPSHKFDAQPEVRTFPWVRMPPLFASHVLFNMHSEDDLHMFPSSEQSS